MKALTFCAAVLVGISMGSAIALTVALKYPKKVLGLGLLGGVAPLVLEWAANPNTFEFAVIVSARAPRKVCWP